MAGSLVNIRLTGSCGSGHGHIQVTINGGQPIPFTKLVSDLDQTVNQDERDMCLTVILKLLKVGRTNAQLATLLGGAGITINFGSP